MHFRQTGLRAAALGAGFALALATPGFALTDASERSAGASSQCTPFSTTTGAAADEFGSCLKVTLRLSEAPAVGRTARLDIEVAGTAAPSDVRLDVRLPAGLEWVRAPQGLRTRTAESAVPVHDGRLHRAEGNGRAGKGASWRLSGTVKAVAAGSTEIRAVATSADGRDTDSGSVFLTVGAERSDFGIAARDVYAAAPAPGDASRADTRNAHRPAGPSAGTPVKAAAGQACATGGWGYTDHLGTDRVSANAQVRVYDADTRGRPDLLASGLTAADGSFRLCFDNTDETGGGQEVYVQFGTENPNWMVRHGRTKQAFTFATPVAPEATDGATVDVGAFRPADASLMRGVEAFDAVNTGWNWKPGTCWDARDTTCRQALINWAPDSTDGTYYSLQSNDVHLAAADPDSHILVLHELGHGLMDDVYEDAFPTAPNCSPHYIHRMSSEGCAWTEGFATWFGAAALNDPTFRWPDGRTRDLEGPTWGSPEWENGDTVEGRVLGAMIDLGDSTNEPGDTCAENPAGPMWSTFLGHVSGTFREYWAHRTADGHDVGPAALDCLYHNTIDYRG